MERKIWFDGEIRDYASVGVPILTHSLQYGTGIFEGIRAYETEKGAAIFRLREHVQRFFTTAKIYHMEITYSPAEIEEAIKSVVKVNNLKSCYIRPFAFVATDEISLTTKGKKVSVAIAAIPFGQYFGDKLKNGIRCKVSSWRRINSDILPVQAKASGNYLNSVIAMFDAEDSGFDEVILLSSNGHVAEGPGENLFLVKNGKLLTPGVESDILLGITRFSVIDIARDLGIETIEREIHRDEMYSADEVFFCGTAAEVTPIVNIDDVTIGGGKIGEITAKLQKAYFDVVYGKNPKYSNWVTVL